MAKSFGVRVFSRYSAPLGPKRPPVNQPNDSINSEEAAAGSRPTAPRDILVSVLNAFEGSHFTEKERGWRRALATPGCSVCWLKFQGGLNFATFEMRLFNEVQKPSPNIHPKHRSPNS